MNDDKGDKMSGDESDGECEIISSAGYLEDQNRRLGGCNYKVECTYSKGYVKRQSVYACLTCFDETKELAGLCYPCSIKCHDDHVVIDMYTKRNFRCDCGNSKFKNKCTFDIEKDSVNDKNIYSHNFKGLYCICNEYEGESHYEQWQCAICENWFHLEHLVKDLNELKNINIDNIKEFICSLCMESHEWLRIYETAQDLKILDRKYEDGTCKFEQLKKEMENMVKPACKFSGGALFFDLEWRNHLCKCENCMKLPSAEYVTDIFDSYEAYLTYVCEDKKNSLDEEFDSCAAGLPHETKIFLAENIRRLKESMASICREAYSRDGLVTMEDAEKFKQKLEGIKKNWNEDN